MSQAQNFIASLPTTVIRAELDFFHWSLSSVASNWELGAKPVLLAYFLLDLHKREMERYVGALVTVGLTTSAYLERQVEDIVILTEL